MKEKHKKILKAALGAALVGGLGAAGYAAHGQHKLKQANKYTKNMANVAAGSEALLGARAAHHLAGSGAAGPGAIAGGITGLVKHHLGRKIADTIIDRKASIFNAHKRARQKKLVANVGTGLAVSKHIL